MKKIILLCLTALSLATVNMALASDLIKCPAASIQYKKSMTQYDNWMVLGSERTGPGKYILSEATTFAVRSGDASHGFCFYTPDGLPRKIGEPLVTLIQSNLKPYGDHWQGTYDGRIKSCIENDRVDLCEFKHVG